MSPSEGRKKSGRLSRNPAGNVDAQTPRGGIHIIFERCKGCGFCVEFCPRKVLRMSNRFNAKGYRPPEVIDASACVNCNMCQSICPEFAIYTTGYAQGDDSGE